MDRTHGGPALALASRCGPPQCAARRAAKRSPCPAAGTDRLRKTTAGERRLRTWPRSLLAGNLLPGSVQSSLDLLARSMQWLSRQLCDVLRSHRLIPSLFIFADG